MVCFYEVSSFKRAPIFVIKEFRLYVVCLFVERNGSNPFGVHRLHVFPECFEDFIKDSDKLKQILLSFSENKHVSSDEHKISETSPFISNTSETSASSLSEANSSLMSQSYPTTMSRSSLIAFAKQRRAQWISWLTSTKPDTSNVTSTPSTSNMADSSSLILGHSTCELEVGSINEHTSAPSSAASSFSSSKDVQGVETRIIGVDGLGSTYLIVSPGLNRPVYDPSKYDDHVLHVFYEFYKEWSGEEEEEVQKKQSKIHRATEKSDSKKKQKKMKVGEPIVESRDAADPNMIEHNHHDKNDKKNEELLTLAKSVRLDHLVILCVHSHHRFTADACIHKIRAKLDYPPTTVVSLPCCHQFNPTKDIGRQP